MNQRNALIITTIVIAGLAWLGPIYLPMILIGPILAGAIAGAMRIKPQLVAIPWLIAGLITLVLDLAINGEDVAFHAVVAIFTATLAAGLTALVRRTRGCRAATPRGPERAQPARMAEPAGPTYRGPSDRR